MIANLELEPGFVIDHQGTFGVDFGDVNAFGALLGDVNKTRLKQLDQLRAQITQHEQSMHIEVTDCQRNIPTSEKAAHGKRARQKNGQADSVAK
jgi:hypothetical protein